MARVWVFGLLHLGGSHVSVIVVTVVLVASAPPTKYFLPSGLCAYDLTVISLGVMTVS